MSVAASLSTDELRELAEFRASEGVVLSLFLGGSRGRSAGSSDLGSRLDSLAALARRQARAPGALPGPGAAPVFAADLERAFATARSGTGTEGFACFADEADGLFRSAAVYAPVVDAVRVAASPYLVPLACAQAPAELVAAVGRERGQIYRLEAGRLVTLLDLTEEQPRRHRDAEAWRQSREERRVDDRARRHLRRVARELDRFVRESAEPVLVLAGEQEHTSALAELLSLEARAALAGSIRAEAHEDAAGLAPLVTPVFGERALAGARAAVEGWQAGLARGRAVQGWNDVLAAASSGRVERLLFVEQRTADARRCPRCGRVWQGEAACPGDGTPLAAEPDALDLAVRFTLANGGEPRCLDEAAGLAALQGIGALVRF